MHDDGVPTAAAHVDATVATVAAAAAAEPAAPPPASSRTLDARLELVGFAGAFDAAAQAATASVVAEEIAERVSLSAGLIVTDVVVVSYGYLARLEVVLRRRESQPESVSAAFAVTSNDGDWSPLADALAADAGVSPASRVVLGVAAANNATLAFEVSVASVASVAAGDSLASLAASAAVDGTSAFASRANETGYAVVDAAAVGSVTATAVRVTLVEMTQSDASSADAALDFGVSAVENGLRVAVDAGSVAAKLRARGFDVDASAGASPTGSTRRAFRRIGGPRASARRESRLEHSAGRGICGPRRVRLCRRRHLSVLGSYVVHERV